MARRVLIVESDRAQMEIIQSLLGHDESLWRVELASDTVQAIELLGKRYFDLVFAGVNIIGMPGVDFLNEVWQQYPKISRFLICTLRDQELLTQCAFGLHQMIVVPCDTAVFRKTLDRCFAVEDLIGDRKFKAFALRARTFPSIPSLYFQIVKELQSQNASAESLSEIICKDLAVTTKMLQAANSAFYGLQQHVTQLKDAIVQIGLETMQTLVLSIQVFSQYDKVKPIYFSIDSVWRHCHAVAERAKKIVLEVNGDEHLAEEAFIAGLLHDIGKVVLACNCDKQYRSTLDLAKKSNIHQAEAEMSEFGFTHGETGGYLASQLGMPIPIIEAITLHHRPSLAPQTGFNALTAVHIADVMEHQAAPKTDGFVLPKLDLEYLKELGMEDMVNKWLFGESAVLSDTSESSDTQKIPSVVPEVPLQPESQISVKSWYDLRRKWAFAVGCTVALVVIFFWIRINISKSNSENFVKAGSSNRSNNLAEKMSQGIISNAVISEDSTTLIASNSDNSISSTNLLANSGLQAVLGDAPPQEQTTNQASPDFQLQGIMYNPRKPIAMINQQWVSVGRIVDKAEVMAIERNQVVVRFEGRDITLYLH